MSVNFKQLLETSYVQVSSKLEEMQRFFAITRTFSIKTNGHFKILTSLVNELIDSEDTLHLIDTELTAPSIHAKAISTTTTNYEGRSVQDVSQAQPHHSVSVNVTGAERSREEIERQQRTSTTQEKSKVTHNYYGNGEGGKPDNGIDKVIESFKSENEKLWEYLKKGDTDAEFIKTVFEKLLESVAKKEAKTDGKSCCHHDRADIHNHCHCGYGANPVAMPMQVPVLQAPVTHSCYVPPQRNFAKSGKKFHRYSHNIGSEELDDDEEDGVAQSVKSLKAEIGKMNEEIRKLRNTKKNEDSGVQDILKKFIELKGENERIVREKDMRIADLLRELGLTNDRADLLKREIADLKANNKMLEETVHEIMRNPRSAMGTYDKEQMRSLFAADRDPHDFEREIDELKDEIFRLKRRNDELLDQSKRGKGEREEVDYYKTRNETLTRQLEGAEGQNKDLIEKNEKLYEILEKRNDGKSGTHQNEKRSSSNWERSTNASFDDLMRCIFTQADYIENNLATTINSSIFKA